MGKAADTAAAEGETNFFPCPFHNMPAIIYMTNADQSGFAFIMTLLSFRHDFYFCSGRGEKSSFTDKRKSKFIATFFNATSACQSKPAADG
jgi:hypothetical protein